MGNKNKDKFASREAANYDNPIASREFIMELLDKNDAPMSYRHIADILEIGSEEHRIALQRRLGAMERDGQIIRNRKNAYGLISKMQLVCGRVSAHPDGFGFLIPDEDGEDLFLSARQMRRVFHRDRVLASVIGVDRRGRREGAVVEILQRNTQELVGRFNNQSGVGLVEPDSKQIIHEIIIPPGDEGGAEDGQIVTVHIVEQPTKRHQPIGKITEILGEHMAPGMEIDIAIRAHNLPHEWPAGVEDEVKKYSPEVSEREKKNRIDLTHLPLVTIDGSDARDFDDAVYCEKKGRGWRLIVAIADVAHYVKIGSALDKSAFERGNSVYFPERVIPMLPEALSNGLCSLNPHVDRLCMVCDMTITATGTISGYTFYNAVFQSHARLIYDDVAALIDGNKTLRKQHQALIPHLENLFTLYELLLVKRKKRGAIEFETTETFIQFDENRKIDRITPLQRNDAHKMIEECMISANICAAKFLSENDMPTVYRVHDLPKPQKMLDLRSFLTEFGLSLSGGESPTAKDYSILLASIRERPDWHLIQTVMLRSLNQAVYAPENKGHFGLALEHYAHFTSPIRRYPDLLVHRAIKHIVSKKAVKKFVYSIEDMQALGEQCSSTERRADDATRDVVDWLKCEFMMDKVGEEFSGIVTGVTSFGLFVELQEYYVEGLIHVTSLSNDYYRFDPVKHCLLGERTQSSFRLGDTLKARVVRVNLDEKKIDFDLAGQEEDVNKGRKRKGKGKPGKNKATKKIRKKKTNSSSNSTGKTKTKTAKKSKSTKTNSRGKDSKKSISKKVNPKSKKSPVKVKTKTGSDKKKANKKKTVARTIKKKTAGARKKSKPKT